MSKTMVVAAVAALVSGCGDEAPSCQQALAHYYGVGCTYFDGNTGREIGRGEMTATCVEVAAEVDGICDGEFADWLNCNNEVTGPSDAQCDCSAELQALVVCGT